jgi:hypothetical protein
MQTTSLAKHFALSLVIGALMALPSQAGAPDRDLGRAGLSDLSHEMSTCAAYFSLLSSIVEKSAGPEAKPDVAQRIKSTGQAMLVQAINVANYIGVKDDVPMERVQVALKEMAETVNRDPPNSLKFMHTQYGQPCDELLETAPKRFVELLKQYQGD